MDFDETPESGDLKDLSELAKKQLYLQAKLSELESEVETTKKELDTIQKEELPNLMLSHGVRGFTLDTGQSVSVKNEVKASISKARQEEAFAWLEENNAGALIKNEVSVSFKMKELDKADALIKLLSDNNYACDRKMSVHPQSLTSFVKERLLEGLDIPFDLLGVFTYDKAIIKN